MYCRRVDWLRIIFQLPLRNPQVHRSSTRCKHTWRTEPYITNLLSYQGTKLLLCPMAFRSLGYRRNCLPRKCTKKSQFASVNYKLLYTFCKVGKHQWWSSHGYDAVVYHVQYYSFASYDCAVAAEGGAYPSPPQAAHCRVCIRACVKSIYVLRRTLYVHILPSAKTDANANDDIRLQAVQTIESQ